MRAQRSLGRSATTIKTRLIRAVGRQPPALMLFPLTGFIEQGDCNVVCAKSASEVVTTASTTDAGKIRLGGGYRLPVSTADAGKIRLGGGYRLPASIRDAGKIRLGGGYRLPLQGG